MSRKSGNLLSKKGTFSFLLSLLLVLFAGQSWSQSLTAPALSAAMDGQQVDLSWSEVSAATGYTLFYAPLTSDGIGDIQSADMNNLTSFSTPIPDETSFFAAVKSYSPSASSDFSNIETLLSAPALSTTVDGLQVDLSWSEIPGATGYEIRFTTLDPETGVPGDSQSVDIGNVTQLSIESPDNITYLASVRAYREDAEISSGTSGYSNVEVVEVCRFCI